MKTRITLLTLALCSLSDHGYLKEKNVPHIWHVDEHAHDFQHWKKGLYNFSQLVFKPTTR